MIVDMINKTGLPVYFFTTRPSPDRIEVAASIAPGFRGPWLLQLYFWLWPKEKSVEATYRTEFIDTSDIEPWFHIEVREKGSDQWVKFFDRMLDESRLPEELVRFRSQYPENQYRLVKTNFVQEVVG